MHCVQIDRRSNHFEILRSSVSLIIVIGRSDACSVYRLIDVYLLVKMHLICHEK
uniref:Uncharacterized protein n=1 Tax=Arundo donax TaxID=35708 RepID=A0A0A9FWS1_ARUDO